MEIEGILNYSGDPQNTKDKAVFMTDGNFEKYIMSKIAVVIPAYLAESSIRDVITGIPDLIQWIVVVDDCSPDQTSAVVASINDSRIILIRHSNNMGVGGAMWTGYQAAFKAGAQIIVKMDSDDQMDPDYIPDLIDPIIEGTADYTKGNRFLYLSHIQTMPFIRRIGNIALSFLCKVASGYWRILPMDILLFIKILLIILLRIKSFWIKDTFLRSICSSNYLCYEQL